MSKSTISSKIIINYDCSREVKYPSYFLTSFERRSKNEIHFYYFHVFKKKFEKLLPDFIHSGIFDVNDLWWFAQLSNLKITTVSCMQISVLTRLNRLLIANSLQLQKWKILTAVVTGYHGFRSVRSLTRKLFIIFFSYTDIQRSCYWGSNELMT